MRIILAKACEENSARETWQFKYTGAHFFLRGKSSLKIGRTCAWVFPMCFIGKKYFYGTYEETFTGFPQVLESPGIC